MKKNLASTLGSFISKNSPQLLTGLGICGMIATTVTAVAVTRKALVAIDAAEEEKEEPLTVMEKVKVAGKYYIPAAITGVAATTCLVCANNKSVERTAAMSAMYTLSDNMARGLEKKLNESIGPEETKKAKEEVYAKQAEEIKPRVKKQEVISVGEGETLFLDPLTGRYFTSTPEKVKSAQNKFNQLLLEDYYATINDWYYEIDLDSTDLGAIMGWHLDEGGKGLVDIGFFPSMTTNNRPCIVLDYSRKPREDFMSL